jgi:hypothetical protein
VKPIIPFLFALPLVAACARSEPAKSPAPPQAKGVANTQPPSQTPAFDDDQPKEAKLVVARDVVQACPNLRVMQSEARAGAAPDGFWIMVLDGVSECMNAGGLTGVRHIAVVGEPERRDVVRLVLAAKGAPMDRVEIGTLRSARVCDVTGCRRAPSLVTIQLVR